MFAAIDHEQTKIAVIFPCVCSVGVSINCLNPMYLHNDVLLVLTMLDSLHLQYNVCTLVLLRLRML
jgi:hypothetical protein